MVIQQKLILFGELDGISNEETQTDGITLNLNFNSQIKFVSSSNHSVHVVLEDGSAYSLGSNKYGDLGIGPIYFAKEFQRVQTDSFFTGVFCGESFTAWTDDSFFIHISGKSFGDQPTLFPTEQATSISAFGSTIASITTTERVLLWSNVHECSHPIAFTLPSSPTELSCGDGFACVLCHGVAFRVDVTGSITPLVNIQSLRSVCVSKVVSSVSYIITLDEFGCCWIHGDFCDRMCTLHGSPIATDVNYVFAMPGFCIFVCSNGCVFGFGENSFGQIGDGTRMNRYRLTETRIQNVRRAVGGRSFCVYLCDTFDSSLLSLKYYDFIPEYLNSSFEKQEDILQ